MGLAPGCSPSSPNRWTYWGRRESVPAAEEHSDLLPKDEQDALTKQRKRNALQMQLNLAVEAEHFEEAAKLRDELRALEQ